VPEWVLLEVLAFNAETGLTN